MSTDEGADGPPGGYEEVAEKLRTSSEQDRTTSEQAANSSEPSANNSDTSVNIDLLPVPSETRAKPGRFHREAVARQRSIRAKAERKRAETGRKPSDLLKYARKHAPSDGDERETRCAWIVRDDDAPLGEWWICKRCEVVLDSSAKVGAHRCRPKRAPRLAAARSAQQSGARSRWWSPW